MKIILFCLIALISLAARASDDLVPATSEDIQSFDQQLARRKQGPSKSADSFGAAVSEEAAKLKDSGQKKGLGKWVSEQRRQDSASPAAAGPGRSAEARRETDLAPGQPDSARGGGRGNRRK